MEAKTKTPQIYGYVVCLVAIITFLNALSSLIKSVIDLHALRLVWGDIEHLSSSESFKIEACKSGQKEAIALFEEVTLIKCKKMQLTIRLDEYGIIQLKVLLLIVC